MSTPNVSYESAMSSSPSAASSDPDDSFRYLPVGEKLESTLLCDVVGHPNIGVTSRSFAATSVYDFAPNPVLSIGKDGDSKGRWSIGLPLSPRDLDVLRATFGGSSQTTRIPASHLHFGNLLWAEWIKKESLGLAKTELGVGDAAVSDVADAVLYGPNSEAYTLQSPTQTTESEKTFGTIEVILPSLAEYDLNLSANGSSGIGTNAKNIKAGSQRESARVAIAVSYLQASRQLRVKSVNNAHCLCLRYRLQHTGQGPLPRLPDNTSALTETTKVLSDWLNEKASSPVSIILEHSYDKLNAKSELAGQDKARARVLCEAGRSVGVKVFAASLKYTRSGTYDEYVEPDELEFDDENEDFTDEEAKTLTMDETSDIDTSLEMTLLADLTEGVDLPKNLSFEPVCIEDDENYVPKDWQEDVTARTAPVSASYDNCEGILEHTYEAKAFVLLPESRWASFASEKFSYRASGLLDAKYWSSPTTNRHRLAFAEKIIEALPTLPLETSDLWYNPRAQEQAALRSKSSAGLLNFALELKRFDLFTTLCSKIGTDDTEIIKKAASVFSTQPSVTYDVLVSRIVEKQVSHVNKMRTLLLMYKNKAEKIQAAIETAFIEGDLAEGLHTPDVLALDDLMDEVGKDILESCVYSKIGFLAPQSPWLSLLPKLAERQRHRPDDADFYKSIISRNLVPALQSPQARNSLLTERCLNFALYHGDNEAISLAVENCLVSVYNATGYFSGPPNSKTAALLSQLDSVEKRLKQDAVTFEPHAKVLQEFFLYYILPALGPRPTAGVKRIPPLSQCGTIRCGDCTEVNKFLQDSSAQKQVFAWGMQRRKHCEYQMPRSDDISIDNPHCGHSVMTITKTHFTPAAVAKRWEPQRRAVWNHADKHKAVLGNLWGVINMAIGVQGPGWTNLHRDAAREIMVSGSKPDSGAVAALEQTSVEPVLADATGNKRKRNDEEGKPAPGVRNRPRIIDLTDED